MAVGRLKINSESIVHETIEGEVIAIDLGSGSYFSLSGSAPRVWEMLAAGASAEEVTRSLKSHYEAEPGEIAEQVEDFLSRLSVAKLVVSADQEPNGSPPAAAIPDNGGRVSFVPLRFERYDDMQDYFLLDPIHEVSPEGWPKPAE